MQLFMWNVGWIVLAAAWFGPLPELAGTSFTAHMTLHMAVVAVAAPLLAVGMAGRHYDPTVRCPRLFAPVPASVGELLLVWAWHSPGLHHWARHEPAGFVVEQATFLFVGLWLWLSAFGGTKPRPRSRSAAGVVGLLLTSMHMTLLGALLALSPRLLFEHHGGACGLTPLEDQHLGGAVMLVIGGVIYLGGGLILTRDLIRSPSGHTSRTKNSPPDRMRVPERLVT